MPFYTKVALKQLFRRAGAEKYKSSSLCTKMSARLINGIEISEPRFGGIEGIENVVEPGTSTVHHKDELRLSN